MLPSCGVAHAGRWPFSAVALRDLAAGFVVGLLAAGAAGWVAFSGAPREEGEDWRSAVAEYMQLYTNETFALPNPDRDFQAKKLSVVADRVGANLTPERVALPGLRFESAYLLSYDGAPLGEIVYVDAHGSPVLFCVIANAGAGTPNHAEKRGDLALSSWSHSGRGYLVCPRSRWPNWPKRSKRDSDRAGIGSIGHAQRDDAACHQRAGAASDPGAQLPLMSCLLSAVAAQ